MAFSKSHSRSSKNEKKIAMSKVCFTREHKRNNDYTNERHLRRLTRLPSSVGIDPPKQAGSHHPSGNSRLSVLAIRMSVRLVIRPSSVGMVPMSAF